MNMNYHEVGESLMNLLLMINVQVVPPPIDNTDRFILEDLWNGAMDSLGLDNFSSRKF